MNNVTGKYCAVAFMSKLDREVEIKGMGKIARQNPFNIEFLSYLFEIFRYWPIKFADCLEINSLYFSPLIGICIWLA